jgi:hypothetical protein
MAQFDPSIISQIPDMAPNPIKAKADAYTLSNLADTNTLNKMKLSEAKQQQGDEERYKQILKGSDWSTDEGATKTAEKLTQEGLPERAVQFMKERQGIESGALDIQKKKLEIAENQQDAIVSTMDVVISKVKKYKEDNPNATAAMLDAKTQEYIVPAMEQLARERPDVAPAVDQYRKSTGALTYDGLFTAEAKAKKGQELLKQHLEQEKAARDERAQNTRDIAESNREADTRRRQQAEDFKEAQVKKKEEENEKADDATADLIGNYRYRPPTGIGSRSPEARVLMEKVLKKYPDYDATRFDEKRAAVLAFGTGKQGDSVRALNNAIAHMDILSELTDALDSGNVKRLNQLGNLWAQETGNPAPTDFDAAKHIVSEEVGKAVLPGGGVGQERLEIAANADKAKSPAVLKGVMKTWKRLLSGQMLGLKRQYTQATGLNNFDEMMTPQALRELEQQGPAPTAEAPPEQTYDPKKPGSGIW